MSRTEVQVLERCLKILGRLTVVKEVRISELHRLFEGKVSRRTLERDLHRLSDANIPLLDTPGVGKERIWKLDRRSFQPVPTILGAEEVTAALLFGELARLVVHTPFAEGLTKLRERLRLSFPIQAVRSSASEISHFHIITGGVIDYRPHKDKIEMFLDCVTRTKRCNIVYRKNPNAKITEINVEPYLVLWHADALYAVGYSTKHHKYVTLPFHRMISIKPLSDSYERKKNFSVEHLVSHRMGIIGEPSVPAEKIILKFHPPVSYSILEREWHPTQQITELEEGIILVELKVSPTNELISWILRWQRFCEVLSPAPFRKEVEQAISETLKHYQ